MTSRRLQECIEEFIEIYRNEPCLWQIKCKDYHDRARREAAYSKLVEKLKEVEPSANKESVVKKINNIRSNYRKELKKVKASSKTGSGTDDIYEPKLWYFKFLCFLNDQDIPRKSRTNIESDDDETRIEEYDIGITSGKSVPDGSIEDADESPVCTKDENSSEPAACTSASTPQYNRPRPSKRNLSSDQEALTNDVLLSINNHFKRPANQDDRFDIFGKNVAMKLRDLPKQQRLIAEKIINETLFEAEMGNLTMSQGLTYQHQHQLHTINPTPPPMYQQYQQRAFSYHSATPSVTPMNQQQTYPYDSATPSPTTSNRTTPSPRLMQEYQQQAQHSATFKQPSEILNIPEDSATSLFSNFGGDNV